MPPSQTRPTNQTRPPNPDATAPVTLLILGASGDLTQRLLLPGLATLGRTRPGREIRLLGVGQAEISAKDWTDRVRRSFQAQDWTGPEANQVLQTTSYRAADCTDPDVLRSLLSDVRGALVIYFALPPAVTVAVCRALRETGVPEGTTLALEKPFGNSAPEAAALDRELHQVAADDQIFRVDHILGCSGTLTLLGLRFANRMFESVWNATAVAEVQIVWDETLALEGRAGFYDGTGALVDMFQSHLLQVLALVAMEPPATLAGRDGADQVSQALRATRVWGGDPVSASRRARYTAGQIGDRQVPDFVAEDGVDPSRNTETLAEVSFEVNTGRWAGVPFWLRSGKALGRDRFEIRLHLRPVAHPLPGLHGPSRGEMLIIDILTGAVTLEVSTNGRGDPYHLERTTLRDPRGAEGGRMTAYGEVLAAIIDGQRLLSVRGEDAVRCWQIVEPVRRAFATNRVPMQTYPAGSLLDGRLRPSSAPSES